MLCRLHKSFYKKCPKNHVFVKHKKTTTLIWCRIPTPSLINRSLHPTITLLRIQKFRNYRFCQNSENDAYGRGWGHHLVCAIVRHWVRKSICDSLLMCRLSIMQNRLKPLSISECWISILLPQVKHKTNMS